MGRRVLGLTLLFAVLAAAYVGFASTTARLPPAAEQQFDRPTPGGGSPLLVYVEVLAFDPMRDVLEVTLDFATVTTQRGSHFADVAGRDMALTLADGTADRHFLLRKGEPMRTVHTIIDLSRGNVDAYPFDRYAAEVAIDAHVEDGSVVLQPLPMRLVFWSRLAPWRIQVLPAARPIDGAGIGLHILVDRPPQVQFFALTLYAAMAVVGCIGLTIGFLLPLGVRRLDTTLAAVLSAMTFALPAMRNIMPGAPPLGVVADSLVFLWAELAVVIGLALVILTWAMRGEQMPE